MTEEAKTQGAVEKLVRYFETQKRYDQPVGLWVGAGVSAAAGIPTLAAIDKVLRIDLGDSAATLEGFALLQSYRTEYGPMGLENALSGIFKGPFAPCALHTSIARLHAAGVVSPLLTTNYDNLLERALADLPAAFDTVTLEQNISLAAHTRPVLMKLHGDQRDWKSVVLDEESYAEFESTYPLLVKMLDLTLRQRPVVFVGCSMRDPRILDWLTKLPANERKRLHPMRVLQTESGWNALPEETRTLLTGCNIQPVLVDNHDAIGTVLRRLADRLAPLDRADLTVVLEPGEDTWRARLDCTESWSPAVPNPLRDSAFRAQLGTIRTLSARGLNSDRPDDQRDAVVLRQTALAVGAQLTALLGSSVVDTLRRRVAQVDRGRARLTLRVPRGKWADQALALPWELLTLEPDTFVVERAQLDLVREALQEGAPGLPDPDEALTVVVSIAAPEDASRLRYEAEARRLLKALRGQPTRFAELGTLDDLVDTTAESPGAVLHFSGHGLPGALLFEDGEGFGQVVPVETLRTALNTRVLGAGGFPRLFFLASCHGASTVAGAAGAADDTRESRELSAALGEGPSTAATLHRAGFAAVLGYFGPVSDELCTRAEEVFYAALVAQKSLLQAAQEARQSLTKPLTAGTVTIGWPLAWAQLAVYLRGDDRALLRAPVRTAPPSPPKAETPAGLPSIKHGFVGRRATQHRLRRRTKDRDAWFVLIHGLGGLGKTSLATHLLQTVFTKSAPENALVVRCDGIDAAVADPLAALVAQVRARGAVVGGAGWEEATTKLLGDSRSSVDAFEKLVSALAARRPGLVLYVDNAETLQVGAKDDTTGQLGAWIPAAEALGATLVRLGETMRVLVTSRYRWDGLDSDDCIHLDSMRAPDMLRLVEALPELQRLPFARQIELVTRMDGRPGTAALLDGLVGTWRKTHHLSTWCDADVDRMVGEVLPVVDGEIARDLVLARLWGLLPEDAREDARRLALLRTPVPREVADVVTPAWRTLEHAGLLTLVREQGTDARGVSHWLERWAFLTVVRDFVLGQGSLGDVGAAHRAWADAWGAWKGASDEWRAVDVIERVHHLHAIKAGNEAWPLLRGLVVGTTNAGDYRGALALMAEVDAGGATGDVRADALVQKSMLLTRLGLFAEALEASVVASTEAVSELSQASTLRIKGEVLSQLGRYTEAEALLREAVRLSQNTTNKNDSSYAASLHELADVLSQQGKHAEAETLLQKALSIKEQALGKEHPNYGASLHALARVLSRLGKYSKAETLLRMLLRTNEHALGKDHPSYAASQHELAGVLSHQGKYAEAEHLLRHALRTNEQSLGKDHPIYAASQHELAEVLSHRGKYAEAEDLLHQALRTYESKLGKYHPAYSSSLHALAGVLSQQGQQARAESLLREALRSGEPTLGTTHPDYAASMHALAGVLSRQGKHSEAEALLRQVLRATEETLGDLHPSLAPSLGLLALRVAPQNPFEAHDYAVRALSIERTTHGDEPHPNIAFALQVLARIEARLGRYKEARDTIRQALAIFDATLGADHPRTRQARALAAQLSASSPTPAPTPGLVPHVQQLVAAGKAPEAVAMLSAMAEQAQHADQAQPEFLLRTLLAQAAHAAGNTALVRAALDRAATLATVLPPDAARVLTELRNTLGVPTTP